MLKVCHVCSSVSHSLVESDHTWLHKRQVHCTKVESLDTHCHTQLVPFWITQTKSHLLLSVTVKLKLVLQWLHGTQSSSWTLRTTVLFCQSWTWTDLRFQTQRSSHVWAMKRSRSSSKVWDGHHVSSKTMTSTITWHTTSLLLRLWTKQSKTSKQSKRTPVRTVVTQTARSQHGL